MTQHALISLFAGAGGLDLGLEMAGFQTRVANELEPWGCETLRLNKSLCGVRGPKLKAFVAKVLEQKCYAKLDDTEKHSLTKRLLARPKSQFLSEAAIIEGDIRKVSSNAFIEQCRLQPGEEVACIAGGPPCQPFSRAGKRQAVDDVRNGDLFYEFVRLVNDIRPRWFIFENVKGLILTKTDLLWVKCAACKKDSLALFQDRMAWGRDELTKATCPACGSKKTQTYTKTKAGGSLDIILTEFQRLGYLCQHTVLNAADFGAPQIRERLFIVGSRDQIPFEWPTPTHHKKPTNGSSVTQQLSIFNGHTPQKAHEPWVSMYDALWSGGHSVHGALDKELARLWVKNVVRPHDEPVTWSIDRPSPTIGAHQGAKLALAPVGVPEEQIFRQQWHTKGRRQGDTKPVPVVHAYLSDEELLRLQTFPSWWYLHGTRMQRAFQIGNAVPPLLAKAVGEAVIAADKLK